MFYGRRRASSVPTYAEMTAAAADAGFDVADLSFASSVDAHDELASADWERSIDAVGEVTAARGLPIVQVTAPYDPLYLYAARSRMPKRSPISAK